MFQKFELKPGSLRSSVSIYLPDTVAYVELGPEETRRSKCLSVWCEDSGFALDFSPSNINLLGVEILNYETFVEGGRISRPEAESGILALMPPYERISNAISTSLYLKSGLLEIIFGSEAVEKFVRLGDHLYVGLSSNKELLQMLIYVSPSDIKTGSTTTWSA